MSLPPSESESAPQLPSVTSELSGDLDRAADDYMKRAARLDPVGFARIAARYPTRSLRSFSRPRHVEDPSGAHRKIYDVSLEDSEDEGPVSDSDRQQYREWLQGQGLVP